MGLFVRSAAPFAASPPPALEVTRSPTSPGELSQALKRKALPVLAGLLGYKLVSWPAAHLALALGGAPLPGRMAQFAVRGAALGLGFGVTEAAVTRAPGDSRRENLPRLAAAGTVGATALALLFGLVLAPIMKRPPRLI